MNCQGYMMNIKELEKNRLLTKKDFNILDKNLTYYRQSQGMISSNFKFLSFAWWRRRKQAHDYVQYFFDKNKLNHEKNLDYLLTNLIYIFIK